MIYRGVKVRDLVGGEGRGIEKVGEVPLCWDCGIEIEVWGDVGGRSESPTLRQAVRSRRERKRPLNPSRLSVWANASDPIDGVAVRVRQKPKIPRPCHKVQSSRLNVARFSEPG